MVEVIFVAQRQREQDHSGLTNLQITREPPRPKQGCSGCVDRSGKEDNFRHRSLAVSYSVHEGHGKNHDKRKTARLKMIESVSPTGSMPLVVLPERLIRAHLALGLPTQLAFEFRSGEFLWALSLNC
jgi:hypothetical protein